MPKWIFNLDTACVELHLSNGSTVAIDTIAVENEFAKTIHQRSELDWLIYNDPDAYADLILTDRVKEYLNAVREGQKYIN